MRTFHVGRSLALALGLARVATAQTPEAPTPTEAPAPPPVPVPSTALVAPPPAPLPSPPATLDARRAIVHLASNYPETWLELRGDIGSDDWRRVCLAPCDHSLVVFGSEARVSAPGMSTSNRFRIDPGPGVALVKVKGGSAILRTLGIVGLVAGVPLGLGGTGMYSYGRFSDDRGLAVTGAIVLGTGAVAILAALPLLLFGTTDVRNGRGSPIAARAVPPTL